MATEDFFDPLYTEGDRTYKVTVTINSKGRTDYNLPQFTQMFPYIKEYEGSEVYTAFTPEGKQAMLAVTFYTKVEETPTFLTNALKRGVIEDFKLSLRKS